MGEDWWRAWTTTRHDAEASASVNAGGVFTMTITEEFDAFWAVYPRRVAKLAAEKAFKKARTQATFAELVDGVQRYIKGKPSYADYAFPASWLNAGRWLDEYDTPTQKTATDWWTECQRVHGGTCLKRWDHEWKMKELQS